MMTKRHWKLSEKTIEKLKAVRKIKNNKGKHWKLSEETKQKMSNAKKGIIPWNKGGKLSEGHKRKLTENSYWKDRKRGKMSIETKKKLSEINKGRLPWNTGKKRPEMTGENNHKWIKDRTGLAKHQERNDMAYKEWRSQIYKRDNYKCRINNQDCNGRIIAHHILPWIDFSELRYEVNNGITLCQAHHPRKRVEEKRLIPFFSGLVSVSNV